MPRLELFLFGSPRLIQDGKTLVVDARKTSALLSYLVVTGERQGREVLLALLWPELEPRRAQNVLRRNLSMLNKTLDGRWLAVERDSIGLDDEEDAWVDVIQFRHLAHSWRGHGHAQSDPCPECLRDLADAVMLYRADFLTGFSIRNSLNFDNWQLHESEQFKRELASVLERLVSGYSEQGALDEAIRYAQDWFALDPLHEPLHRWLMMLYADKGDRSAALRQYHRCVELLNSGLGVPPEQQTISLYKRLRRESEQHRKLVAERFAIIDGDTETGLEKNLLGSSKFGRVYRGVHVQTGEAVAIKVLEPEIVAANPDFVARFVREGEALRQLNHPNIVKLLSASEQEGRYYLVMEYVGGGSLKDLIAREGMIASAQVVEIALDLADALTRAHRLGIIHRDLRPANILLAADGTPRLTDFGTAFPVDSMGLTGGAGVVGLVNYLSPEACAGRTLDERTDIWAFGLILYEMLSGERPFKGETAASIATTILTQPVPNLMEVRADIPVRLAELIGRMLEKEPSNRIASVRQVGAELEAIRADRLATPGPLTSAAGPPPCPYRGLFAFQEEDAPNFFGREAFARQLIKAVKQRSLAAVVGPSGSGKSSVVFAGLLATLKQESNWIIESFRPGSDPFQELAITLLPHLEPNLGETDRLIESRKLAENLRAGTVTSVDVVSRIIKKKGGGSRLLLVVDQFEELYTLCSDPEDRHTFLDILLDCIELQTFQPNPTITFVLTLRADFLEQALSYRPLADAFQDADLMLGPMTREELSRAIEMPADNMMVTFEAGLVERILDDVGEEPGNLPLLEFALTTLWEQQQAGVLTHKSYEAIGRVEGALTRHADQAFTTLKPGEQEAARQILVQLVRPGEGTADTRRTARRDELGADGWALVQQLADARLVMTGRNAAGAESVEIIHEVLIRRWGRLREWMSSDRDFRLWQERLRVAVNQWRVMGQDEGAMLRGVPLAEAERWLIERGEHLSQGAQAFIQASVAMRERRRSQLKQDRLARERLRQRITLGAVAGLIISLGLAVLAGFQWSRAAQGRQTAIEAQATAAAGRDQAFAALSRQLAALSSLRLSDRLDLALLLSLEATWIADTGEARNMLRAGLVSNPGLMRYLWGHGDRVSSVSFSPDGSLLASGSNDNKVMLWDVASGQLAIPPLSGHTDNVLDIAFSPDGQWLATASADKSVMLWDVDSGQPIGAPLTGHRGSVGSVTFSPEGRILASSGDETIILWNISAMSNGDVSRGPPDKIILTGHRDAVRSVAFSPDGQTLASGSNDMTVRLWDPASGEAIGPPLTDHTDWVRSVTFSPDGRQLASASENGDIILWEMSASPRMREKLNGHTSSVRSVSFSPAPSGITGGYLLASGSTDGTIILWDGANGQSVGRPLMGHTDWVRSVVFSPDGQTLASASDDRSIILWDVSNQPQDPFALGSPLAGHRESVRTVAFSPDGQTIASGSDDESIILWDAASGEPLGPPLRGHSESVRTAAFSPDGRTLATGSNDGNVVLWDVAKGESLGSPLSGHKAGVQSVAFSPDGRTLASGSSDETVILWDVGDGGRLGLPLAGHRAGVQSVAFSPDGRTLASAGDDKTIVLWDLADSPVPRATLTGHKDVVFGVTFSPDGQILASSSWDKTIILWDVASGEPLAPPLLGHTESVQSVAFSPDGQTLASGSWDESVILWDVASGQPLTIRPPLLGHSGSVRSVAFAPDGRTLVSASDDGTILLWDVSLESWQSRACRRANRNLTKIEWLQFFGEQAYRASCPDLPSPQG